MESVFKSYKVSKNRQSTQTTVLHDKHQLQMTRKCGKIAIALIFLSRTANTTKMIEKKQGSNMYFFE